MIGELESLGKKTATVFRLAPWTYTAASPTEWSRSAGHGRTQTAYREVSTPQDIMWMSQVKHRPAKVPVSTEPEMGGQRLARMSRACAQGNPGPRRQVRWIRRGILICTAAGHDAQDHLAA
ncbi:MAG: hypothetical protein EBR82_20060 [Caulobacteraceae bacterium]|nr:hypothetical protein [Caulobacteraceae bacterium]